MSRRFQRVALPVTLVLVLTVIDTVPSSAVVQNVSKGQVDEACAEYRGSKETLDAAIEERDVAQAQYADLYSDREATADRVDRLADQILERREELVELRDLVVEWAVESYMAAETEISGLVLRTRSLDELITGQEFIKAITTERVAAVDRWRVIVTETEMMEGNLIEEETRLVLLEIEANQVAVVLASATDEALYAARELKGECRRLYQLRQTQLAVARALEEARRSSGAAGVSVAVTPGFICPMDPGAVSFINDWRFPRSGGRRHRGNDVFAPKGRPVYAVTSGSVLLKRGGLGGTALWLSADNGVDYYYAHLDGYAAGISTGVRVAKGRVIGYNGNTGNARGGAPHLHFQLHPNGRTNSPVNPYQTLVRSCR